MADFAGTPYIDANDYGGRRPSTQLVVIHATDNTASAADEAAYCSRRVDSVSAHLFVDGSSAYQCVPIDDVAYCALWHANQVGVHIELCGRSNAVPDAVLRRAAPLVAAVCTRYGIPIRKLSPAEVRAGQRGIVGHADVTAAWPEDGGDHTDPGSGFPWSTFISYVAGGDDMAYGWDEPLGQGTWSAPQQRTTALAFAWERADSAAKGVDALTPKVDQLAADVAELKNRPAGALVLSAEDRAAIVAGVAEALRPALVALRAAEAAAAEAAAEALRPAS